MPEPNPAARISFEHAQSKCTWTFDKSHFVWTFTGKMPDPNPAARISCEPAQSKRTWTFDTSHFVSKFAGKMPDTYENTSIKHRALTLTVRTPQCGHPVWGKMSCNLGCPYIVIIFLQK